MNRELLEMIEERNVLQRNDVAGEVIRKVQRIRNTVTNEVTIVKYWYVGDALTRMTSEQENR